MVKEVKLIATLDDGVKVDIELPVLKPTIGNDVVDISEINKALGIFTHDPGFVSTSSCESKITYIDGDLGKLLYRGYPIEQLAEKSSFLEVAHLLLFGEIPTSSEKEDFIKEIDKYRFINEGLKSFFGGFYYDAHPMAMLTGVVSSLSAFYPESLEIRNEEMRRKTALRLIAKMPIIAAAAYKRGIGEPFVYPDNSICYTADLLRMMFDRPGRNYEVDPVATKALDILFILHADHEQNASTSTVRLSGSTGTNPYAAVSTGIASLWGPAHGGANEAVIKMLDTIGDESNIEKYIEKAKDKNDPFRLMGFGHRVYHNYDPRAKIIRQVCYDVLEKYGRDKRLELAMKLEEIALKDEYFIERKLYPNVDFYSGIIYSAIGIPTNMFTVMFAIARTAGWVSHWNELVSESYKIGRPRQLYTGKMQRNFNPK